jgi:hypothetical protein
MEIVSLVAFAILCVYASMRPPVAFALVLLMFPIEMVLQSTSSFLRTPGIGLQLVNIAIGMTALLAVLSSSFRTVGFMRSFISPSSMISFGLLAWGATTLLWSPGRQAGIEATVDQLPYLGVILVLGPLLVPRVDVLVSSLSAALVIATALCLIVLINPEFVVKSGRLGFEFGGGLFSNPLALGELGGLALLLGSLIRRSTLGALAVPLRVAAILAGTAVAIQSGSRGQFFYALIVAVPFVPFAAPVKSARNLILALVAVVFVGLVASFLLDTLLSGFAAKRFSVEEMLYGTSSSSERMENVLSLGRAWAQSPTAWIFGLGYYAFNGLFADAGSIYSHVLFADVIFEMGLPGVAFMSCFVYLTVRDSFRLYRLAAEFPLERAACTALIALFAYQLLLVNKQGNLWGSMVFFLMGIVISRLVATWDEEADAANGVAVSGSVASLGQPS